MISEKREKPRMLATAEEVDKISRSMNVWVNTFPEKPVTMIKYESLDTAIGEETAMALSTIQGTYITKQYILGGYQAEYQFKLIYRIWKQQVPEIGSRRATEPLRGLGQEEPARPWRWGSCAEGRADNPIFQIRLL